MRFEKIEDFVLPGKYIVVEFRPTDEGHWDAFVLDRLTNDFEDVKKLIEFRGSSYGDRKYRVFEADLTEVPSHLYPYSK